MNTYAKVAIAAVVVIAVGIAGLSFLGPASPSGVGGPSAASPSPSPSATPSPSQSASTAAPPALTETFRSSRYGFTISYPTGWVARPATHPWTTNIPDFMSTEGDIIYDPVLEGNLWIVVASKPLAGKSGTQWANDLPDMVAGLDQCGLHLEPITIDGSVGQLCSESSAAAVAAGDRGYIVLLYVSGDDPAVAAVYDREYFAAILATLQLTPEEAVDAPASASPSPS